MFEQQSACECRVDCTTTSTGCLTAFASFPCSYCYRKPEEVEEQVEGEEVEGESLC